MEPSAWITLAIGLCGLALNLAAFAVGYGVLKGTMAALDKRVEALEAEASAITEVRVKLATVETKLDALVEQFRDFNAQTSWMRAGVAAYEPPPGVVKPRTRKRL